MFRFGFNFSKFVDVTSCLFFIIKELKISDILIALDQKVKTIGCKKDSKKSCNGKSTKCITHNFWDELDIHINSFFENKKLSDLLKNREARI